jgi:hypothetical protein
MRWSRSRRTFSSARQGGFVFAGKLALSCQAFVHGDHFAGAIQVLDEPVDLVGERTYPEELMTLLITGTARVLT